MKLFGAIAPLLLALPLFAQQSQLGADFSGEHTRFDENCLKLNIASCAQMLFTDHPLHLAVGSLAPQNGFGSGIAFVSHYTPNESWRLFFDADAVATPNLSWRAGAYMTAVLVRHQHITVQTGGSPSTHVHGPTIQDMPVFHVYSQAISLNKIDYFGLGQGTSSKQRSYFGMRETIAGANLVWPVAGPLNLSLLAEANGRFTSLRGTAGQPSPPIQQVYDNNSAPGLLNQPGFAQFGEGVRVRPNLLKGYIRLNYSADFQSWIASNSTYSFRRFNVDLAHQFPLYSRTRSLAPREFNGPDNCAEDSSNLKCPPVSRNLEGSFGFQFLYTASYVHSSDTVPFYFDPTLGGSDLNGNTYLASYQDYRFRGPDLMLLRGSFEHSLGKLPLGAKVMLDEGRVGLTRSDLGFSHLAHSYAAGVTVHAGGLPVIDLLFAWGGHEGTHTIAQVSNSLLGGTSRPSLY